MVNFTLAIFNDSNSESPAKYNFSFTAKQGSFRTLIFAVLKFKSQDLEKSYDKEFFKSTIDICSISKGAFGNILTQKIFENMANSSNVPTNCPIKSGYYYGLNVPLPNDVAFSFILDRSIQWEMSFVVKGKRSKSALMVQYCTFKLFGILHRLWSKVWNINLIMLIKNKKECQKI